MCTESFLERRLNKAKPNPPIGRGSTPREGIDFQSRKAGPPMRRVYPQAPRSIGLVSLYIGIYNPPRTYIRNPYRGFLSGGIHTPSRYTTFATPVRRSPFAKTAFIGIQYGSLEMRVALILLMQNYFHNINIHLGTQAHDIFLNEK